MIKEAKAIAPEDGEIIQLLRDTFRDEPLMERLAALRAEFRGIIRGLENRIANLERENYALRGWIASHETGVRTSPERRDAMAGYVEASGVGLDNCP